MLVPRRPEAPVLRDSTLPFDHPVHLPAVPSGVGRWRAKRRTHCRCSGSNDRHACPYCSSRARGISSAICLMFVDPVDWLRSGYTGTYHKTPGPPSAELLVADQTALTVSLSAASRRGPGRCMSPPVASQVFRFICNSRKSMLAKSNDEQAGHVRRQSRNTRGCGRPDDGSCDHETKPPTVEWHILIDTSPCWTRQMNCSFSTKQAPSTSQIRGLLQSPRTWRLPCKVTGTQASTSPWIISLSRIPLRLLERLI